MNGSTPVLLGFGGQLAAGALVTAGLAGASLVAGLVLGLVGAGARLSRYRLLRGAGHAYTTAVRGVPEMLVVLLVYFGASAAVRRVAALAGITGRRRAGAEPHLRRPTPPRCCAARSWRCRASRPRRRRRSG